MLFEKTGKYFSSERKGALLILLVLFPPLFSTLWIFLQFMSLKELENAYLSSLKKGKKAHQKMEEKKQFLERYSQADPFFLDHKLESLVFLKEEKKVLQNFASHPAIIHKEALQRRLKFLNSRENQLRFIEENIKTFENIKETDEKQLSPVQMDKEDLKQVLSLIEDVNIDSFYPDLSSPQLIIKDLKIKKTRSSVETEPLEVEMELLKREFLDK